MVTVEDLQELPNNADAEKSVLSCIFSEPNLIYDFVENPDIFFSATHRVIYKAMLELNSNGKQVEAISVLDVLRRNGDDVFEDYFYEIVTFVFITSHFQEHKKIVIDYWYRRKTLMQINKLQVKCYTGASIESIGKAVSDMLLQAGQKTEAVGMYKTAVETLVGYGEPEDNSFVCEFVYDDFQKTLGGYRAGCLYTVGARPSVGKSVLLLNLAVGVMDCGKRSAFFSTEMKAKEIQGRFISLKTRKPLWLMERKDEKVLVDAFTKMQDVKYTEQNDCNIYYKFGDFTQMCNLIRKEAFAGTKVVFIDYLQQITHSIGYNAPLTYVIGDMSYKLKNLAGELDIAIVMACQLNREVGKQVKDMEPKLHHLKDSWSIEQDSDVVLLLHREELYDQYSNKKNILDVFFAKNRQGRTGAGELYFEKPIFTMRNMKEVSESDKMNNNQDEQKSF